MLDFLLRLLEKISMPSFDMCRFERDVERRVYEKVDYIQETEK